MDANYYIPEDLVSTLKKGMKRKPGLWQKYFGKD